PSFREICFLPFIRRHISTPFSYLLSPRCAIRGYSNAYSNVGDFQRDSAVCGEQWFKQTSPRRTPMNRGEQVLPHPVCAICKKTRANRPLSFCYVGHSLL